MASDMTEFRRAVASAAVLPIALLVLVSVVLTGVVLYMRAVTGRVGQVDRVIGEMNLVERQVVDQETGLRGYLLTGDEAFLAPYRAAEQKLPASAQELRALVADPSQVALLEEVLTRLDDWHRSYAEGQLERRRGGADIALTVNLARGGKARMDGLRAAIATFQAAQERLRAERLKRADHLTGAGLAVTVVLFSAAAFLLPYGAARTLRRVGRVFEDALRTRDDFIAVAAHELKNPLTAFRLQVETLSRVLKRSGPDVGFARIERGVGAMQQSAARFVELVNRLLDVSRISAGKLQLDVKELDLAQVVAECVERMRPELEHSGSPVEVRAQPSVGRWDRLRVESVVTNLLSNAVKYGRGKPIDISVDEASGGSRLVVRDQGIGIALQDQARIFARFERAVPRQAYEGLGIGLWLTQAIVEAHGGTIRVESQPGQGATFFVQLPKVAPASADAPTKGRRPRDRPSRFDAASPGCEHPGRPAPGASCA
jgi:signal transduction histidine kinase